MKRLFLSLAVVLLACTGGGAYYTLNSMTEDNFTTQSHYIHKNDNFTIGAKIRSGGAMGVFWWEVVILNTGNSPMDYNFMREALYYELDGKEFIAGQYNQTYSPSAINPDEFVQLGWGLDKKYTMRVNDIEKLKFRYDGEFYDLEKNENAIWQELPYSSTR